MLPKLFAAPLLLMKCIQAMSPMRKHAVSGEVSADGVIELTDDLLTTMPKFSSSIVRGESPHANVEVSPGGYIKISADDGGDVAVKRQTSLHDDFAKSTLKLNSTREQNKQGHMDGDSKGRSVISAHAGSEFGADGKIELFDDLIKSTRAIVRDRVDPEMPASKLRAFALGAILVGFLVAFCFILCLANSFVDVQHLFSTPRTQEIEEFDLGVTVLETDRLPT